MQPVHKCSQDCETLHKEISKKIFLILLNSRLISSNESSTIINKNNWFGLETPLGRSAEILQGHEETIKSFLCGKEAKEIKILIYLDNDEGTIGVEDGENGKKGSVRKGKALLEIWTLKFNPKNVDDDGNEGEIRKLYKRTSLYIRSLFTISRLLPSYSLLQQKLPLKIEIEAGDTVSSEGLSESLIASDEGDNKTFEAVNSTSLSLLQTTHGDLRVAVQFKKLPGKFYTIVRSPAIRVPQQVIKAKDIQINSSPATTTGIGSGEWIDMTQQNMYTLKKVNSATTGQIKILTTAHKPGGSSLATETSIKTQQQTALTDFIKIFEKPELVLVSSASMSMGPAQLIEKLEQGRSKKILFDRWLEELEIEHESLISGGFDLINNME